jgi:hypothetical protein
MARWYHVRGPVGALTVLLVLSAVANGLLIVALLALRDRVDDYTDRAASLEDVENMVGVVALAFLVVAGLMIAVFVLTIVWQWRLAKNHQLLGRPDTAFGPGWAIGGWFIPLANLVIPILQLRDLWKGSAPGLPRGSPVWKRQSTGALLLVWWGLFVASVVIDWISSISVDEETDELSEVTGQLDRMTGVAVLAYSLRIAAAILFILVIKRLTTRQEAAVAEVAALGPAWGAGGPAGSYGWPAGTGTSAPAWTGAPGAPGFPTAGAPSWSSGAPVPPPGDLTAGWKPDPTGRADHRYWDGVRWTDHASVRGSPFVSPM